MSKICLSERDLKRRKLAQKYKNKRQELKDIVCDEAISLDERFAAQCKLAKLPRNSSETRIRNRCANTGRPRGFHRKFGISRNQLREMASKGLIPGMVKSSW